MEVAKLVDEREYEELRIELLQLKREYLKNMTPETTIAFIQKAKDIQERYLTFLEHHLLEELKYPEGTKHLENIFMLP
jgi:hypothetical protein